MAFKVGDGALKFELVPDWQKRPADFPLEDIAGVATDSADNVYLYARGQHPVSIYDRDGNFLDSWGEGRFSRRSHGIFVSKDDDLFLVDDGMNFVGRFSLDGELRQIIGPAGIRSDSGFRDDGSSGIRHGAGPYNSPTNLTVAPSGDIYVSDGYRNASIHRFGADGQLKRSWGDPGIGHGRFRVPHGLAAAADGRIFVADRENDLVQIFSPEGEFLAQWEDIQRPQTIAFDKDGLVYVAELSWFAGETGARRGAVGDYLPARLSIFSPEGELLLRWSDPDPKKPGSFIAPHGLWLDSTGAIYVSEVTEVWAVPQGKADLTDHRLQKFIRL